MASFVIFIIVESLNEIITVSGLSWLQTEVLFLDNLLFQLLSSLLILFFNYFLLLT